MAETYRVICQNYDVTHLMTMPLKFATDCLKNAAEKQNERRVWEQWLTIYPNMDKESYVSFSDFLEESKQQVDRRNTNDLLAEISKAAELMKG